MNRMQPRDVACNAMRKEDMRPVYLEYIQEKRNERRKKNKNKSETKKSSM